MTQEEKAKAYDELKVKASRIYHKENDVLIMHTIEDLFPELKESEDERIRKGLLNVFTNRDKYLEDSSFGDLKCKDIISWLEKKSEQKPVDKTKPKFHEGDWVVSPNGVYWHIDKISNNRYEVTSNTGKGSGSWNLDTNIYHKFTIQDAKDGDVLCCENGWTCIFKALDNHKNTYSSYCFMDSDKWFCNAGSECHTLNEQFIKAYNSELHPATKEQRDLLFQKMKEAGYVWDAEKKELRKIEQKPADKIEPKFKVGDKIQYLKGCGTIMTIEKIENDEYIFANNLGYTTIEDGNKWYLVERNPTWSEEDETVLDNLIYALANDRIGNDRDEYVTWLKSLRSQNHWKPSDEQILAISTAINVIGKGTLNGRQLIKLREELQKLMEE